MLSEDVNAVIGPLIMLAVAATAVGAGAWHLRRILWLRRHGVRVPGVVVGREHRWRVGMEDAVVQARRTTGAVVEFHTREGRPVRAAQKIRFSHNMLGEGRRVTVAYDPADPGNAEILQARSQLLGAGLFLGVGTLFSVVGLALAVRAFTG